jgi:hypothetical protein
MSDRSRAESGRSTGNAAAQAAAKPSLQALQDAAWTILCRRCASGWKVLFQRCPQLHGFAVPPDEQAEAAQLLRGRTFARTVH